MSSISTGPNKIWKTVPLIYRCSLYAVGCCLAQVDELGDEHLIAYGSQKLSPTQSNWSTIEREAYAILWALNRFHDVIFGSHVVIKCDISFAKYYTESQINKMGSPNPAI